MKSIPPDLQAYFPKAPDPARPWWSMAPFPNGISSCPEWQRGEASPRPLLEAGRVDIDKTDPIPPPPILVGQVWALREEGSAYLRVSTIGGTIHDDHDASVTVYWTTRNPIEDATALYRHGFLLSCPFGYAPWSGVEVVP